MREVSEANDSVTNLFYCGLVLHIDVGLCDFSCDAIGGEAAVGSRESGENRFRLLFFRQSLPQKVGLAMFGEQLGVEAHRPVESDLVMLDLPGGPDDAGVPQGLIC